MKELVDLIKSGSYVDIFYAKTCSTTKKSTVSGYHVVLAMLLFFHVKDVMSEISHPFVSCISCLIS